MQQDASPVIADLEQRPYSASALAFYGLAIIVAIDIALAGTFNPDRGEFGFWIMLVIIFGGVLVWSVWIARRLSRGKGALAAYSLLGILTGLVGIGALIQLTRGYPETTPFPGMRALSIARIVSGAYLIVLWIAVIRDSVRSAGRTAAA
jgi:hypothetical protein